MAHRQAADLHCVINEVINNKLQLAVLTHCIQCISYHHKCYNTTSINVDKLQHIAEVI